MRSYRSKSDIKKLLAVAVTVSSDLKVNKKLVKLKNRFIQLDSEKKKSGSMECHRTDFKTVIEKKSLLTRSISDLNLAVSAKNLKHDVFFNHKRKVLYETHLAQLLITHIAPFMPIVKKVSDIILLDIKKMAMESGMHPDSISTKMSHFFLHEPDLQVLFGKFRDPALLYEKMINVLESRLPEYFYHQMCIQRAYIIFFTEKGKANPEMTQAIEEKWTAQVNLENILSDVKILRHEDVYFKKIRRLKRKDYTQKTTTHIGILPTDDYKKLSLDQRLKLERKLPLHTAGMLQHIITTEGDFVACGMLEYDMPVLCGPSGNTAMRLALANQAGLSLAEKNLFAFCVSLYHVAIGAHTIDECFMIANVLDFSRYIRGDYNSIVPEVIKKDARFRELWTSIQVLNENYQDILSTSFLASDNENKNDKEVAFHIPKRLKYLDLADSDRQVFSEEQQVSHLIRSLKDNYFSYGLMIIDKEKERKVRDQKNFYESGFFALPRVPLPKMKEHSHFLVWQRFVRQVFHFFDGENREEFVSEIHKLERRLCELSKNTENLMTDEELLEKLLTEFEEAAGFSTVFDIKPTDGVGGILTPAEFKKLLTSGRPINDLGTTFQLEQHGKLSHRLQFYILGNYFLNHVSKFFTEKDLNALIDQLTLQHSDTLHDRRFPIHKIISVFYRLLGTDEFNNCFDWKSFAEKRTKLNLYYNEQDVPPMLNKGSIWVQLFDRYGYAGYFSVPSTFGFLQKLGCFPALPKIGEPKVKTNKHLRIIMDVTRPFFPSASKNKIKNKPLAKSSSEYKGVMKRHHFS